MKHTLLVLATWIAMASFAQNENSITGSKHFQKQFEKTSLGDIDKLMVKHSFVKGNAVYDDPAVDVLFTTLLKLDKSQSIDIEIYYHESDREQLYVITSRDDDYVVLYHIKKALEDNVIPSYIENNNLIRSKRHDYFSYLDGDIHRNYLIKWCCY